MAFFIRVDDRLIHGQTMCAWVPYLEATSLVVASDDVAADKVKSSIMTSCCYDDIDVCVKSVDELLSGNSPECLEGDRVLLIVSSIVDAMRLYDGGLKFDSINIGNLHHSGDSHRVSPSVDFDDEDDAIIERMEVLGIKIDLREVPESEPSSYNDGKGEQ